MIPLPITRKTTTVVALMTATAATVNRYIDVL
jgi:hypothetical protein